MAEKPTEPQILETLARRSDVGAFAWELARDLGTENVRSLAQRLRQMADAPGCPVERFTPSLYPNNVMFRVKAWVRASIGGEGR